MGKKLSNLSSKAVEKLVPIRKRPSHSSADTHHHKEETVSSRYPKRVGRISYQEAEVPDDDNYLCKYNCLTVKALGFFLSVQHGGGVFHPPQ